MRSAVTTPLLIGGFVGLLLEKLQNVFSFFRRLLCDIIDTAGLRRQLLSVVTEGP